MLQALKSAGCRNYSIYMKGQDLFAYMEVEDFQTFLKLMAANPESDRWEANMAGIMERGIVAETGFHERLVEVFHLD